MNDDLLDSEHFETEDFESKTASKGLRFANALLDGIIVGVPLSFLTNFILYGQIFAQTYEFDFRPTLINWVLVTTYFIIIENATGKSIGKMITGKVIDHRGNQPTSNQIMKRSLARLIPFEAFSFLGEKGIGWHDSLSKTYVIQG
jgi:uncharacterized RDD family membrane protein YckC